jgi:hypothetical protein
MYIQPWSQVLVGSFDAVWGMVITFIPTIFVALVICIIGWMLGMIVGKAVSRFITLLNIDAILESVGVGEMLSKLNPKA